MATPAEVKTAILNITGVNLTDPQLLNLATLYCESWGSQWSNPWDETDNPTEYAAWPTAAEVAQFFADKTRSEWQQRVYKGKYKANRDASNSSDASDAAAESAVLNP